MTFLMPLDLLSMSHREQDVIRCLTRRPRLTAGEIAGATKIPLAELEDILGQMVQAARLVQEQADGQSRFAVAFGRSKPARSSGGLLDSLFG